MFSGENEMINFIYNLFVKFALPAQSSGKTFIYIDNNRTGML